MGHGAATATAPLVDDFLEELRVEDGSSALTIAAYRRDLGRLVAFLRALSEGEGPAGVMRLPPGKE